MTTTKPTTYRITQKALRGLMMGLYYPAVLGAGIVFLLLLFPHIKPWYGTIKDFRFWFGLLFAMFFSFSYFTIGEIEDSDYKLRAFLCDLIESFLVFAAFGSLGLYETPPDQPNRTVAYLLFLGLL